MCEVILPLTCSAGRMAASKTRLVGHASRTMDDEASQLQSHRGRWLSRLGVFRPVNGRLKTTIRTTYPIIAFLIL